MKVNDGAFHNIFVSCRNISRNPDKGIDRVGAPFFAILHCSICYGRRSLELKETKPGSWI